MKIPTTYNPKNMQTIFHEEAHSTTPIQHCKQQIIQCNQYRIWSHPGPENGPYKKKNQQFRFSQSIGNRRQFKNVSKNREQRAFWDRFFLHFSSPEKHFSRIKSGVSAHKKWSQIFISGTGSTCYNAMNESEEKAKKLFVPILRLILLELSYNFQ